MGVRQPATDSGRLTATIPRPGAPTTPGAPPTLPVNRPRGPWPAPVVDAIEPDVAKYAETWAAWGHRKVWAMMHHNGYDVTVSSVKRAMADGVGGCRCATRPNAASSPKPAGRCSQTIHPRGGIRCGNSTSPARIGREAGSLSGVGISLAHPGPHCGLGQIEVPAHLSDPATTLPAPLHDVSLELRAERPTSTGLLPFHRRHDRHPFRGNAPHGGCPPNRSRPRVVGHT